MKSQSKTPTIVVGVDGSDTSQKALSWALDEAKLRGAELLVIHAWTMPMMSGGPYGTPIPPLDLDLEKDAESRLDRLVERAATPDTETSIRREVVQGSAAQALIAASRSADLLVVGSRGLGGFTGLLLGSVGHQCAQHASCPVVIIPHVERATGM